MNPFFARLQHIANEVNGVHALLICIEMAASGKKSPELLESAISAVTTQLEGAERALQGVCHDLLEDQTNMDPVAETGTTSALREAFEFTGSEAAEKYGQDH